jgi:hypothetical protein
LYRRGKSCASEADEEPDPEDEDPEDEDPPVLVLPLLLEGGAEEDEEDGGAEVVGGAVVGGAYSTTAKLFSTAIGSDSFILPLTLKHAAAARADTRRKRTRIVILRVCEKDLGHLWGGLNFILDGAVSWPSN